MQPSGGGRAVRAHAFTVAASDISVAVRSAYHAQELATLG
jgi:hypothetical protein